jgi:methyl-accepting chemotaxis protein
MLERCTQLSCSIESTAGVSEESAASAEEVSASTEEQTASVEQMSACAQELAALATGLKDLVERFTLDGDGATAQPKTKQSVRTVRAA